MRSTASDACRHSTFQQDRMCAMTWPDPSHATEHNYLILPHAAGRETAGEGATPQARTVASLYSAAGAAGRHPSGCVRRAAVSKGRANQGGPRFRAAGRAEAPPPKRCAAGRVAPCRLFLGIIPAGRRPSTRPVSHRFFSRQTETQTTGDPTMLLYSIALQGAAAQQLDLRGDRVCCASVGANKLNSKQELKPGGHA